MRMAERIKQLPGNACLDVNEIAELLHVNKAWVHSRLRDGKLPNPEYMGVGHRRKHYWKVGAVRKFLASHESLA